MNQAFPFSDYQMKFKHLAPLALFVLASTASAEGFYVLGEVTHSSDSLDKNYFNNVLGANGATGLSSSDSGSGNQWRLQGGYRFNPYLALEAGYIDFGKATYKADYNGGGARGSLKAGGVNMNILASLPVNDQFSVFGKAGMVYANVKSSLSAGAPASLASGNTSSNVVRPLLGLGADYKLNKNVDLRADYDYVSGLGDSGKTGKMDSNMFSMGVAYTF